MEGTNRGWEQGGGEPAMCDPGPVLRVLTGGRETKQGRAKIIEWDGMSKKKKKKKKGSVD